MGYKQVSKTIGSMDDNNATPDEVSTIIADKTHLANLISALKSEMSSTNELLKSKEHDYNEAKMQVNRFKDDLNDANKRIVALEKQCEQYRQTVSSDFYRSREKKINIRFQCEFCSFFVVVVVVVSLDQTFGRSFENIFRYD